MVINLEGLKLPRECELLGRLNVDDRAGEWKANRRMRYHLCMIPKYIDLKSTAMFPYRDFMPHEVRD